MSVAKMEGSLGIKMRLDVDIRAEKIKMILYANIQ